MENVKVVGNSKTRVLLKFSGFADPENFSTGFCGAKRGSEFFFQNCWKFKDKFSPEVFRIYGPENFSTGICGAKRGSDFFLKVLLIDVKCCETDFFLSFMDCREVLI